MGVCSCRRPIHGLATSLGLQRHTLSLSRNSHAAEGAVPTPDSPAPRLFMRISPPPHRS